MQCRVDLSKTELWWRAIFPAFSAFFFPHLCQLKERPAVLAHVCKLSIYSFRVKRRPLQFSLPVRSALYCNNQRSFTAHLIFPPAWGILWLNHLIYKMKNKQMLDKGAGMSSGTWQGAERNTFRWHCWSHKRRISIPGANLNPFALWQEQEHPHASSVVA